MPPYCVALAIPKKMTHSTVLVSGLMGSAIWANERMYSGTQQASTITPVLNESDCNHSLNLSSHALIAKGCKGRGRRN